MLRTATVVKVLVVLLTFVFVKSKLPYGSKTPYQQQGDLSKIAKPAGCRAVHLNMVLRHGSRYPCKHGSVMMFDLLKKINQIYESKPYKYKNLTLPWNPPNEYQFADNCEQSDVGNQEIYNLAKRFKAKYPRLFVKKYWNKYYNLVTSGTPRTAKSAAAFGYGLFEENGTLGKDKYQPIGIIFSGPKDKDKVLRYYNTCPRYEKEIVKGNGLEEWRKFGLGNSMKKVIMNIEERLQLKGKVNLTAESAQMLFWWCAFPTMNHERRDWCSIFSKDDVDVLEYYDDVFFYYLNSYGHDISYKANCPLVADIINSLKDFVSKNLSYPYGIFRFTHIGTMTALQSILGMYNDSIPLKANNFVERSNRLFRTSNNVPMAANMAFVLYKCDKQSDYMVQILMNERPAVLPCCNNGSLCSLKVFLSCYEAIGNNCDFDAMCQITTPKVSSSLHNSVRWVNVLLVLVGVIRVVEL